MTVSRSTPPHSTRTPAGRRLRGIALALSLGIALAGCGAPDLDASSRPPAAAGLVVLAGEPGASTLTVHDQAGAGRDVPLPDPSTSWVSAGRQGTLLATLDDGTLRLSDVVRTDAAPRWTRVPRADVDPQPEPLSFTTWAPNGLRAAALASDDADAGSFSLVIVDPQGDAILPWPVAGRPLMAPPTWVGDELILVQTTDGLAAVDPGSGAIAPGPPLDLGLGVALAVAADASRVAISPEAGRVEIRDLDSWLAGETGEPEATIEEQGEVGSIAIDRRGERVAIVWQRPDDPGLLTIHAAVEGWTEVERRMLPGESARAVVDWLP